jgi:DNA-binding LytR/AlgR family response regulator
MQRGRKEFHNLPLSRLENMLPENMFCRVHRSYLVNTHAISAIRHFRTQRVVMVGGHRVPVSRRLWKGLLNNLDTL